MAKKSPPRPSAADAARRLVVLKYVIGYAVAGPPRDMLESLFEKWSADDRQKFSADAEARREQFWEPVRQSGLWQYVTPAERELAATTMVTMTAEQQIHASWRLESAHVLTWALGLTPHLLPFDVQADSELLKEIPSQDLPRFFSSARLRDARQIDQARELAELWHWRSRTRQLIEQGDKFPPELQTSPPGFKSFDDIVRFTARNLAEEGRMQPLDEDFPVRGKPYRNLSDEEWSEVRSITMERHLALNWLCGYAPGND